jgi:excisionase family DNA binding protein
MAATSGKSSPGPLERWSSVEEICEHLGISRDTVYRWIAELQMPAHRIGRLWKFKLSEVDTWVRKNPERA